MAKLIDTIVEGTLQVENNMSISGNLSVGEFIDTKGIRHSYLDLGVQTEDFYIDCNKNSIIKFILGNDITVDLTVDNTELLAKEIILIITNNGSYKLNWPDNVEWVTETQPILNANSTNIISLFLLGNDSKWVGSLYTSSSIFIDGGIWD